MHAYATVLLNAKYGVRRLSNERNEVKKETHTRTEEEEYEIDERRMRAYCMLCLFAYLLAWLYVGNVH